MGGKKENKRKFRNLGEAFSNSAFESQMKNVYSIQYIHILYTLHSIQYTVYSIQYTVYSIQNTVHTPVLLHAIIQRRTFIFILRNADLFFVYSASEEEDLVLGLHGAGHVLREVDRTEVLGIHAAQ